MGAAPPALRLLSSAQYADITDHVRAMARRMGVCQCARVPDFFRHHFPQLRKVRAQLPYLKRSDTIEWAGCVLEIDAKNGPKRSAILVVTGDALIFSSPDRLQRCRLRISIRRIPKITVCPGTNHVTLYTRKAVHQIQTPNHLKVRLDRIKKICVGCLHQIARCIS